MAHPTLSLLFALSLLTATAAQAADNSSSTAAALKILTQTHEADHQTPAQAPARKAITVDRSETVDMLIRRQYAGWPLKEEMLRKALAELNPKVLPNAANNLLKRGSTLFLPTAEDLRHTLLRQYPAAADLVQGAAAKAESHDGQASSTPQAINRRWVRYP